VHDALLPPGFGCVRGIGARAFHNQRHIRGLERIVDGERRAQQW
jgi:hypothetical protein